VDPGASQHAGAAPLREGFAPEVAGVAVIALHNLAVHRLLPAPADAALNVLTAVGLTALARRAGCSEEHLGIRAADAAAGLRLGSSPRRSPPRSPRNLRSAARYSA
jgi:hypothetical protein